MLINTLNNAAGSARKSVNDGYNKMTQAVKNNPETTTKVLIGSGVAMVCMLNAERIQGIASDLFCNCNCPNIAPQESLSFFASPISSTLGAVYGGASSAAHGVQSAFDTLCNTVITFVTGTATGLLIGARTHAQDRFVQQEAQPSSLTWTVIKWFVSTI